MQTPGPLTFDLMAPSARLPPPLKWAGGKRWLVPVLDPLWQSHRHRRFVEPFCGGLAATLGLMPERALLNDRNPHLINFYRWLQRGLVVDLPLENDAALFYAHRMRFNALLKTGQGESLEAAALFYFLNRASYNGLCRFNSRDEFNVPFGRYRSIAFTRDFTAYREVLATWTFMAGDLADVPLDPDDFVYADPPYDVPFTQYAKGVFTWDDQVRTADLLSRHPGPVVLSNQATPRIVELYGDHGFAVQLLNAPRRIACTGDRTPAKEVLATRNLGPGMISAASA
jgi:DNA adenine methylase